jgi:EAL domain-containing protein (putative c-di-GMP-specific phosphodiesterase class I)
MIKIDKSFVAEMMAGHEQTALARAVVQLGRTLRLTVIAEGIETAEQLGQLREAGCQLGQGHLFAAALGPADLLALAAGSPPGTAP